MDVPEEVLVLGHRIVGAASRSCDLTFSCNKPSVTLPSCRDSTYLRGQPRAQSCPSGHWVYDRYPIFDEVLDSLARVLVRTLPGDVRRRVMDMVG